MIIGQTRRLCNKRLSEFQRRSFKDLKQKPFKFKLSSLKFAK